MRTLFPRGKQKEFINKILSNISIGEAAELCNLSERTIRDWRREKFLADFNSLKKLSNKANLKIPADVQLKNNYWYVVNGASAGAAAVFKKYGRYFGDPEYRKKKWYEWWEREGKYKSRIIGVGSTKPFLKPRPSQDFAEFIGIVLGDGGVTRNQIIITVHSIDDKEYSEFIINLARKLFNVHVGVHYRKDSLGLSCFISRTGLIKYCIEKGLKIGDKIKQQVDIPNWIKKNNKYAVACVRGLIDTDGCVFKHNYRVSGKSYSYKKLSFTNHSYPLRKSVFNIMKNNGLNPRFVNTKEDVRLDSIIEDMKKYFKIFNSHNPKHLNKYYN